jgi:inositol hexakisphosphate/diphosphoinositol-pentakisphosphate kinase
MALYVKDTTGITLDGPEDSIGGQIILLRKVELLDNGNTLCINSTLLAKLFVKKPVSREDYNICIYYPKS